MPLDVRLFPCLSDNYGFLVRDAATGAVATVDTPDADAILADLERSGWGRLDLILNTHWHPDHTQGNAALKAATGCEIVGPEEVRRAAPLDRVVRGGDTVMLGGTALDVCDTPGHTLGHIVYRDAAGGQAFVGDTLFALGCGRLFEGAPEQMWDSLRTLAAWPDETTVWCAHEYTEANLRWAAAQVPGDGTVAARLEAVIARRADGRPTIPSTIGSERATNLFLRAQSPSELARLRRSKDLWPS